MVKRTVPFYRKNIWSFYLLFMTFIVVFLPPLREWLTFIQKYNDFYNICMLLGIISFSIDMIGKYYYERKQYLKSFDFFLYVIAMLSFIPEFLPFVDTQIFRIARVGCRLGRLAVFVRNLGSIFVKRDLTVSEGYLGRKFNSRMSGILIAMVIIVVAVIPLIIAPENATVSENGKYEIMFLFFILFIVGLTTFFISNLADRIFIVPLNNLKKSLQKMINQNKKLNENDINEQDEIQYISQYFEKIVNETIDKINNINFNINKINNHQNLVKLSFITVSAFFGEEFNDKKKSFDILINQLNNEFFQPVQSSIYKYNGFIDNIQSNKIIGYFNYEDTDKIIDVINEINNKNNKVDWLDLRVGVNTGKILKGNFDVKQPDLNIHIGNTITLSERMASFCKYYGVDNIFSEYSLNNFNSSQIKKFVCIDRISFKEKNSPFKLYFYTEELEYAEQFKIAVEEYLKGNWKNSINIFDEFINKLSDDENPYKIIYNRIKYSEKPNNWNGFWMFDSI